MGTWGISISSNDTYCDVYEAFFDYYGDGLAVADISNRLIAENQEILMNPFSSNDFWFALAMAQWECKQLDKEVYDKIKKIVDSDIDIEIWRKLDADAKDIKKRKLVLRNFLLKLSTEKTKAKSRKKTSEFPRITTRPVFQKGDCIVFKLKNGNFGGAIVLEVCDAEFGNNLILGTRLNQAIQPTLDDFENSKILFLSHGKWKDKLNIHWYDPVRHKKIKPLIEVIGKLKVEIDYKKTSLTSGFCSDFDIWFIGQANSQFHFEINNDKPGKEKKVMEMLKPL